MPHKWPDHFNYRLMGRTLGSSGLSSYAIALEAWRRGLEVTFTAMDLYMYSITDGDRKVDFNFSRPDSITRREDYQRLNQKGETIAALHNAGIPAPRGRLLSNRTTLTELCEIGHSLGYPLVLKPNTGSMGQGVLTNIKDWSELEEGFNHLVKYLKTTSILLEKHHTGEDYRVLVVGDKVSGAVKRVPAHIIGDGNSSIESLISEKNLARKWNPFLTSGLIKIDFEVTKCLDEQNLSLKDIPGKGTRVELRRVANASAGGDVVDVTDTLPVEIKTAAIQAVRQFPRIFIAGVDILYQTGAEPSSDSYVIIEINSRPQIGVNMYPSEGIGRDVPKDIIDELFPGTPRSSNSLSKSIRFNELAIRKAIRSGVASKVTIQAAANHYYPLRMKYTFASNGSTTVLKPYSERILQKTARKNDVIGNIRISNNGDVVLTAGCIDETAMDPMIRSVRNACGLDLTSTERWQGVITTGFAVNK